MASSRFFIASDDKSVIDSAAHYLLPGTQSCRPPQWQITVETTDAVRFAGILGTGEAAGTAQVKPGYTYLRRLSAGSELFLSAEGFERNPHVIVRHENRFAILAPRLDEIVSRVPVRLVREICLRQAQNQGGCFIHAGAVRTSVGGVVVVGPSGAGKTTTLLHLLRDPAARFVANDRGVISPVPGKQNVAFHAWPLAVRIGQGTLTSYPELQQTPTELHRSENDLIQDKLARLAAEQWGSRVKYEFTPAELCHRFDRSATMSCDIAMVVLPELSLNGRVPAYATADPVRASAVLSAQITEPVDAEYGTGWLGMRAVTAADADRAKELLIRHILALPVLDLVGDPRLGLPPLVPVPPKPAANGYATAASSGRIFSG